MGHIQESDSQHCCCSVQAAQRTGKTAQATHTRANPATSTRVARVWARAGWHAFREVLPFMVPQNAMRMLPPPFPPPPAQMGPLPAPMQEGQGWQQLPEKESLTATFRANNCHGTILAHMRSRQADPRRQLCRAGHAALQHFWRGRGAPGDGRPGLLWVPMSVLAGLDAVLSVPSTVPELAALPEVARLCTVRTAVAAGCGECPGAPQVAYQAHSAS